MNAQDLIRDETFLAWYRKTDQEAVAMWEARIEASSDVKLLVEEAVMMLLLETVPSESVPSDEKLVIERTKMLQAIDAFENKNELRTQRRKTFPWVAAASILLLASVYGIFQFFSASPLMYATHANELREIVLPDSSVVSLNHNSALKLSKIWTEQDSIREVWLEGEAFFSIRKTSQKSKFIVHSGDLKVEVLGTTFNVKHQDSLTTVVLQTGKVQLSKEGESKTWMMNPGELAEYSAASGEMTHKQVNTDLFTSWKDGKIIFENASIHEIVAYLEEHYGLQVNYEALSNTQSEFNGTFPVEDVSYLLDALSKAYQWEVHREGNQLILKSQSP